MSGHSKWSQIKRKKEATDQKRSQLFGRLSRDIAAAAHTNPDPLANPALREAIARAKRANMPQTNIDRLLAGSDSALQTGTYEAFGPGGSALLIVTATDNSNRTVTELRTLLKIHDGSLGKAGSARWKFKSQFTCRIHLPQTSDQQMVELQLIEAGADDIHTENHTMNVTAPASSQTAIEECAKSSGVTIEASSVTYAPVRPLVLPSPARQKLVALQNKLLAHPDVTAVYTDVPDLPPPVTPRANALELE